MTKIELLKIESKKQQDLCDKFISFMKSESFIETTTNVGGFASNMPVFYKKVSESVYLVFNIPFYTNKNKISFQTDFWRAIAKSELEFLKQKIEDDNLIDLRLGFDLNRDLSIYKEELLKY